MNYDFLFLVSLQIVTTQLRYYLHLEPDNLTDEEWATSIISLEKIRIDEAKMVRMK